jgi:hypothetical protein
MYHPFTESLAPYLEVQVLSFAGLRHGLRVVEDFGLEVEEEQHCSEKSGGTDEWCDGSGMKECDAK